ncbi:hypothetical protein TWF679_001592 [Orbilia oligospora]|uniref:CID domain-containing protein n=1 Tax=Orbilia oligospora TaxID=2813651 RepID=A0A8H8UVD4_ORBOL|nr:hypothetical protein TWF679_001592 [Orbilia oligospora]
MSFNDEVPSPEELAEDYRSSLEDLSVNSRWEITNLTVIAKENIHAAQAISKVIEEHIQKISPLRKLPALYLLDSIAKNVGTPYTLFFGRNLYRTFMDAYSLVEGPVRRKLEEMLQTWKQPVPGSTSSNPLFPAETTRKIDNALIKARTAAVQRQQEQMKQDNARLGIGQQLSQAAANPGPYRSTPTPPTNGHGHTGPYNPPPSQSFDGRAEQPGNKVTPQPTTTQDTPSLPGAQHSKYQQLAVQLGLAAPNLLANIPTTDALLNDIRPLIATTQARFAENPWDTEIQKRLKALLDLQTILSTQQLPTDQLSQIRDQLSRIAISVHVPAPPQPQAHQLPVLQTAPPPQLNISQGPNLASLLSQYSNTQLPAVNNARSQTPLGAPASAPSGAKSLFESLISAGLLKTGSTPPSSSGTKPSTPLNQGYYQSGLTKAPTPSAVSTTTGFAVHWETLGVELNTAALKIPRLHFVSILNDSLPNKCGSCARRFSNNEQGKKDKAAHLDWHFRVHQRIADSSKHAQFRSWYVGEEEWIKFREDEDDPNTIASGQSQQGTDVDTSTQEASSQNYIPAPNDAALSNLTCPVCKEKFNTVWHPDAEDWVLMDAIQSGSRIYHASCFAEISKESAGTASRGSTPDTSISKGKRKADQDLASIISKIKKEK